MLTPQSIGSQQGVGAQLLQAGVLTGTSMHGEQQSTGASQQERNQRPAAAVLIASRKASETDRKRRAIFFIVPRRYQSLYLHDKRLPGSGIWESSLSIYGSWGHPLQQQIARRWSKTERRKLGEKLRCEVGRGLSRLATHEFGPLFEVGFDLCPEVSCRHGSAPHGLAAAEF